jgi:predicted ATPase/class 3 adenylate cyclase
MAQLPVGTVTFLFTDIEGSTRLVQQFGERFRAVLEIHHSVLRRAIVANQGVEVSTEGDAFFAVFPSAVHAVRATIDAQRELAAANWPDQLQILVRMGLHTGEAELGGDNYLGVDVNRAARIAAAGHGGQVLLSGSTRALVESALPSDVVLRDLGQHRLKDLRAPEHLSQLVIPGLPDEFPALRTLDASPTNLVAPETALIGRDREIAELSGLIAGARLVTLTGPGGIGKTRLALELGGQALGRFADGVFFVPLETFAELPNVAVAIAQGIGTRPAGQREPEDTLIDLLAEREILLILDNLEQLVGAGPFVARLLARAPRLRVIVTSRVPLHLSGEQEYPVSPLALPDAQATVGLEVMARVAAVALFVERARRVRPDFRLTDDNVAAVAAICRRLDGLALAIELAAARVKVLSPAMMLARLDQALPMLSGGSLDLPARQRTLRGAIDWSCRLLAVDEQTFFRRLTVFSGGWTVDGAEQVAAPTGDLGLDALNGLSTLVDQSLVRQAADSPSGEARFEMLQLIREYGAGLLADSDEAVIIGRRHVDWVLALVEAAGPVLESGADLGWLDRLSVEHDNLRAALRWCAEHDEVEIGLRLASAGWRFWQQRGHTREGRGWFERLLPAGDEAAGIDAGVLAAARTAAGGLAYWQNELDDAERHYALALGLDRASERSDRLGDDLYNLGFVAMARGDLDTARQRFAESADLFVAAGKSARLGDTTAVRGAVELRAGDFVQARDWTLKARRLQLELGNQRRATDAAMVLGYVSFRLGDGAAARESLLTALEESRAVGDVGRWPLLLEVGAAIALGARRPRDVLLLAGASANRRAKLGGGPPNFLANIDQIVAEAKATVLERDGADAVEDAWNQGGGLDDDALAELLGRVESGPPGE